MKTFSIVPIGVIRSDIKNPKDAPLFYTESAPNAFLDMMPAYVDGLERMQVGDEIILITWLHRASREVLKVHPRGDPSNPITGVFSTRRPIVRTRWVFIERGFWKFIRRACISAQSKQ